MRITVSDALSALQAQSGQRFVELFRKDRFSAEIYVPVGKDLQQPHAQDEVYIVISGSGIFQNGAETQPFGPGDFLFVPAGVEHRFLEFSEDFKTWVIFF